MDQELVDAVAYTPVRRFVCSHQMAALFCEKWRHCRHIESVPYWKCDVRSKIRVYYSTSSIHA